MRKHSRKRVLVVDDDEHLLIAVTDYLRSEGFDVAQAKSGREALEEIRKSEPDLIILDIGLPEMSGLTFLKQIALDGGKLRYPVLVFTAKVAMESFFSDMAIDGFIPKPCSEADLLRRIREVLQRHAREDNAERDISRLLLGDNNQQAAEALARGFEAAGYDVEVVHSGAQVLESASLVTPDVIVVKDSLPRVTGTDLAAMIASVPALKLVPVVVYDSPVQRSQVRIFHGELPPGVSRYLLSDNPTELLNAINEVCDS
jgi:DNA-binding response OmpR family regulator